MIKSLFRKHVVLTQAEWAISPHYQKHLACVRMEWFWHDS